MVKIKICGITDEQARDAALAAGADWVGFVLAPSVRRLDLDVARRLAEGAGQARAVALVVDPGDAQVEAIAAGGFGAIQLHGAETPQRVAQVRALFPGEVWKAVAVRDRAGLAALDDFGADRIVLDAPAPEGHEQAGGHGTRFDWTLLTAARIKTPWLLAGGLTPGNVARAITVTGAPGVDVSSGVERAPGVKDPERIGAFIRAAKHQEK